MRDKAAASAVPSKATKLRATFISPCTPLTSSCSVNCSPPSERLTPDTPFTTCHSDLRSQVHSLLLSHTTSRHVTPLTGQHNPLDAYVWNSSGPVGVKEYYIKVVPVTYTNVKGVQLSSNQYSVTEHFKHAYDGFPAVYIMCPPPSLPPCTLPYCHASHHRTIP